MKKLLPAGIILLVILILGFFFRDVVAAKTRDLVFVSSCEKPKQYRIGTIDSEFAISDANVSETVAKAAEIWNRAYGKQLFVYDPDAAFTINLVYDNRQSLNTEIGQLNNELKKKDTSLKPEIEEYNRKSDDLQGRIKALNAEIESWNTKGGAPEDEYKLLKARQNALHKEAADLNAWADSLSISTKELNQTVDQLKETVDTYNEELNHKPEGGKYVYDDEGERIEINIYDSNEELENILAHELGHALGMDHVADENSIMFSKTNSELIPTVQDLAQLKSVCAERNVVQTELDDVTYALHRSLSNILPK